MNKKVYVAIVLTLTSMAFVSAENTADYKATMMQRAVLPKTETVSARPASTGREGRIMVATGSHMMPPVQMMIPQTGDPATDAQIKALITEMETKIKAIRIEYEGKVKAIIGDKHVIGGGGPGTTTMGMMPRGDREGMMGSSTERRDDRGNMMGSSTERRGDMPISGREGGRDGGMGRLVPPTRSGEVRGASTGPVGQDFGGKIQGFFKGVFGGGDN